jgi:hypothetical protein
MQAGVALLGIGQSILDLNRSIIFSLGFFFLRSFGSANTGERRPLFTSIVTISRS